MIVEERGEGKTKNLLVDMFVNILQRKLYKSKNLLYFIL